MDKIFIMDNFEFEDLDYDSYHSQSQSLDGQVWVDTSNYDYIDDSQYKYISDELFEYSMLGIESLKIE